MGYKKVLLLRPQYHHSHYEYVGLPAGLGYLSEALEKAQIEQKIVDMALGYEYGYLKKEIAAFKPDLLGASLMSFRYKDHYALLTKLKSDFKGMEIVAGGPHISTFRALALEECGAIDYGITLEGEDTLVELCAGKTAIKGLLSRKDGKVDYSGDRPFKTDLDSLGFPKYSFFEKGKYPDFISLVTSRGCPHSCIFCPVQLTIGKKLRVRSASSVVEEVEYWHRQGFRVFNIVDDNFTFYKQRVLDICKGIQSKRLEKLQLSCRNGVRADTVDCEMLKAMKETGFNYLAFGVESGSDRILEVLKKGESLADMDKAVKCACELGFMVTLFFILGLPYETEEDARKSLAFAMKYPVFDVRFYNLIPFPGTELYDWIEKNGYFDESRKDYLNTFSHWVNTPVFGTPELPIVLRKRLNRELNNKVRQHTFKVKLSFSKEMEGLFRNLGLPAFLSKFLARLYYTELFQAVVVESGLAQSLKKHFKKRKKQA